MADNLPTPGKHRSELPALSSGWRPRVGYPFVWYLLPLLAALGLVAMLPRILSWPAAHHRLFRQATGSISGTIQAESVRLRWFDVPQLDGIRLTSASDEPTLQIVHCEGDDTLWQRIWKRSELGTVRIEQPTLFYTLDAQGISNFQRTFAARDGMVEPEPNDDNVAAQLARHVTLSVAIVEGTFTYQGGPDHEPWTLGPFDATVGMQPATDHQGTEVVLAEGKIVDQIELTPDICRDLIKYIAPVLVDAAWTEGRFTLEVEESRVPLSNPHQADARGTLTIHSVRVGPGPVVTHWLELAQLPSAITLIEESPVKFVVQEGRVHHAGLQFHAGDVRIATSGSVGLDESLDLMAEIQLPHWDAPDRPVIRALSGRTIRIPVRGTLSEPQVDTSTVKDDATRLAFESLRAIAPELADPESWKATAANVQELRLRLRERLEDLSQRPRGDDAGAERALGERRRPLRRLLRSLVPPEADPSTVPPPEGSGQEGSPGEEL